MFLFFTVWQYLEWKLLADRFSFLSPTKSIVSLLIWLVTGWLFGVFSAPSSKGNSASRGWSSQHRHFTHHLLRSICFNPQPSL